MYICYTTYNAMCFSSTLCTLITYTRQCVHVSVRDEWVWMGISVCTSHRCDSERMRVMTVCAMRVRVMAVSVGDSEWCVTPSDRVVE